MMLFYKAWRETRTRFLLACGVVVAVCAGFLLDAVHSGFAPPQNPHLRYSNVVWATFYGNRAPMVFSIFALVLSLGGLQRERAAGTAGFTLALPVTRSRLLIVRVATGLVELTAVALLPALIIPALSPPLLHQSYPFSQALGFTLLYMAWGTVWFGIGVLWSVLFAGEYTAAVLSMLTPFGYMIVYSNISQGGRRFLMANPMEFTSGLGGGFIRMGWMFIDFMPWPAIATLLAVGATLLVASTLIVRRQNF